MRLAASSASFAALALVTTLMASVACNKQPEPIPRETTDKPTPAASGTPTAKSAPGATAAGSDDIGWDAPSSWVSAPNPNPMRKATYKIPKAGGEPDDAELTVSAASGGVDANIKRWEQQFGEAKAKTLPRTVNGLKVTVVEIKGTSTGGGMMGQPSPPKDHQMLLGAIVEAGERQYFFKMVGGDRTVTAARDDFDKFVTTLRAK